MPETILFGKKKDLPNSEVINSGFLADNYDLNE